MKSSWDAEKSRVTKDLKVAHDVALTAAVKDTKKKQWVGVMGLPYPNTNILN